MMETDFVTVVVKKLNELCSTVSLVCNTPLSFFAKIFATIAACPLRGFTEVTLICIGVIESMVSVKATKNILGLNQQC